MTRIFVLALCIVLATPAAAITTLQDEGAQSSEEESDGPTQEESRRSFWRGVILGLVGNVAGLLLMVAWGLIARDAPP